jgi:hypothetical protein
MKSALSYLLVCLAAFVGAADTKPAAPKTTATNKTPSANTDANNIPAVPASPPRMTVESTPGVPFATAFFENQQIRVSIDKLPALQAAIKELTEANLIPLYMKLNSGHDAAVQSARDVSTSIKDNERAQKRLERYQKEMAKKDKSKVAQSAAQAAAQEEEMKKNLEFAKKELNASAARLKKHQDEASSQLTKYTSDLEAYNNALSSAAPCIDRFVSSAGFPKDRADK